jgi:hypothetical protein
MHPVVDRHLVLGGQLIQRVQVALDPVQQPIRFGRLASPWHTDRAIR